MTVVERLVDDGLEHIANTGVWYRSFTGIAAPYGVEADVGWFVESFGRGVFTRSLADQSTVPLLLFHNNASFPIGHAVMWTDHEVGLVGSFKLAASVEAQRTGAAAEQGELGLSVGFQPQRSSWRYAGNDWNPDLGPDHMDHVTRTQARLIEVSMTPTPAYMQARVLTVEADLVAA